MQVASLHHCDLQHAVCCSVLQCVAVCCSVLQSHHCDLQHGHRRIFHRLYQQMKQQACYHMC